MADTAGPYDRTARVAARSRIVRTSRLPCFYDYALRGGGQARLAGLLQILVVVALTLVPARLLTGEWTPPFIAFFALAVGVGVQSLSRLLNARAGRA